MAANTVSTDGKLIELRRAGGATIQFSARDKDGNPTDLSDLNLRFKAAGAFEVDLVPDPDNDEGQLIVISKDDVGQIPDLGCEFDLVDVDSDVTQPLWFGRIRAVGDA